MPATDQTTTPNLKASKGILRSKTDMSAVAQRPSAEFRNYPQLSAEEFGEVCHQLDRRYSQATLGPVRRRWKLRVCRALDTSLTASAEYATFVQIIRPLDGELDDGDLSACLDTFSFAQGDDQMTDSDENHAMLEAEESDSVRSRKMSNVACGSPAICS